jgi:hypothetical protein
MTASEGTKSSVFALSRIKRMRKEDAGDGLGHAEEEDCAPQVEAGEAESGAVEFDHQEMVAADATADAGITIEAGLARTEEAITTEVIVSHLVTKEIAAGEVATAEVSSCPAGQEDPCEVAGEAVKEALTGMRTSGPPKMVTQASSSPGPMPGTKADMPTPGMEIGMVADPPLFGAASGSEKASQGAHTAWTMESDTSQTYL